MPHIEKNLKIINILMYKYQIISKKNRKDSNININKERKLWAERLIDLFIKVPERCPYCKKWNNSLDK